MRQTSWSLILGLIHLGCSDSAATICGENDRSKIIAPQNPDSIPDPEAGFNGGTKNDSTKNCNVACNRCDDCLTGVALATCDPPQSECLASNKACAVLMCCLAGCPDDPTCLPSDCKDPSCSAPTTACSQDMQCLELFCDYGGCINQQCGLPLCIDQMSPVGSECEECITCLGS